MREQWRLGFIVDGKTNSQHRTISKQRAICFKIVQSFLEWLRNRDEPICVLYLADRGFMKVILGQSPLLSQSWCMEAHNSPHKPQQNRRKMRNVMSCSRRTPLANRLSPLSQYGRFANYVMCLKIATVSIVIIGLGNYGWQDITERSLSFCLWRFLCGFQPLINELLAWNSQVLLRFWLYQPFWGAE